MLQSVRMMLCVLLLAPLGALAQDEPAPAEPAPGAPAADTPPAEAPATEAPAPEAAPAGDAAAPEAPAAEGAEAALTGSFVEGFYTPSATLTMSVPGGLANHEDGTGGTLRGLYRFKHWLAFTGEYSQDKFSDANIDLKQERAGVGVTLDNPSGDLIGVFAQYDKVDSDLDDLKGYSGHLRISRDPEADLVHFYLDVGYRMLKGDIEKAKGFEFDGGVVFDLGQWGVLLDYRHSSLTGETSGADLDLGEARVGARYEF